MNSALLKGVFGFCIGGVIAAIMNYGFGRDFSALFYIGAGIGLSMIVDWWRLRRRCPKADHS